MTRVPLTKLHPAPWNPRTIRDERFKNLCRSLEADPEFMVLRPVLATRDGTSYAGNMRYRAAQHLGWTEIEARLTDIPEQLAKERALRDNAGWGENVDESLGLAGVHIHKELIWVKPHFVFGRWEYHWQHEPCIYGWREGHHPECYGDRSESTVWLVDHEGGIKTRNGPAMASLGLGEHPTQNPPELWARAIRNHTVSKAIVYEPFAGSGPAVTAAEQCGRRCYAMEIDARYCDVIVHRWEKLTGKTAVLADLATAGTDGGLSAPLHHC